MAEFDLIAHIRACTACLPQPLLGIGDDCALVVPAPAQVLALTCDTLHEGVHFPAQTSAQAVGHKALAVNLSDLAAMGATPAFCTLSLSMPQADVSWVDGFLQGFVPLAQRYGVQLVGGDTTCAALSISITAHGWVPQTQALRRDGARIGDVIWLTGTVGDAAAALQQWQSGQAMTQALAQRLDYPSPRVDVGLALRQIAHACIDVSDGLLQDLGHLCRASGVGAHIDVSALPASAALQAYAQAPARYVLQACGGDDYELCFTTAPQQREMVQALAAQLRVPITAIGTIVQGQGVQAYDATGALWQAPTQGFVHFS